MSKAGGAALQGHAGAWTRSDEQKRPRRTTGARQGHLDPFFQPFHKAGRSNLIRYHVTPDINDFPCDSDIRRWRRSASRGFSPAPLPRRIHPLDVLPTGVGMVRQPHRLGEAWICSPHGRGDGPTIKTIHVVGGGFSPRAWGWSGQRFRTGNALSTSVIRPGKPRGSVKRDAFGFGQLP